MSAEPSDDLQGQVLALSMVLNAIIQTLGPEAAAQAAVALAIDREVNRGLDSEQETEPAVAASRDAVIDAYLGLLGAVSKDR